MSAKVKNTRSTKGLPLGVLSGAYIKYAIRELEILKTVEGESQEGLLEHVEAATYNMRIGQDVSTWIKGEKVQFKLGPQENKFENITKSLELRPNSLTFVTTIEEFNLPKDILARFNLKSKWVHRGLLLGTGPIVDPELCARLLIPIHNFSSSSVHLEYGDELISVEFTRIYLPKRDRNGEHLKSTSSEKPCFQSPNSLAIYEHKNNENWNFDFDGYRKRIGRAKVESSVDNKFHEYAEKLERAEKVSFYTLIGVVLSGLVLAFTTWMIIDASWSKLNQAESLANELKRDNIKLLDKLNSIQHELTILKTNEPIQTTPSAPHPSPKSLNNTVQKNEN